MQITENIYLVGSEQFGLSHLLDCNCYLITSGNELALIDTGLGLGADEILENICGHGFDPSKLSHVLLTHTHLGHWGGAVAIREKTGAQMWAPSEGVYWMEHVDEDRTIWQNLEQSRWPKSLNPQPCTPDHTFGDGDSIPFGDGVVKTILVQGHTRDSTCFLFETDGKRAMFSGDVVFYGGALGIINADGSNLSDYRRDFPKLANLGIDMLYPGHGVFMLRDGQKHIDRALRKLSDFVLPESFAEPNEFMWQTDYRDSLE